MRVPSDIDDRSKKVIKFLMVLAFWYSVGALFSVIVTISDAAVEAVAADADQAIVVGAIVVIGAVADTPLGRHPMLVFRFEGADGAMLPPIALLVDAPTMRNIPGIITGAANAAIRRAGAS